MVIRAALAIALCSCGARMQVDAVPDHDEITLYRDHALVAQHIEVVVPEAEKAVLRVAIAAGVAPQDVSLIDRDGLSISQIFEEGPHDPTTPTTLHVAIGGLHAGRFSAQLAYSTTKLRWEAGYTLTTPPAHDRATLHGAVGIINTTGVTFHGARVQLVDADLGMWRGEMAQHVAGALVGATEASTSGAAPRALGTLDLAPGETRVDLVPDPHVRAMRSVLVYDPVGTKLDTHTTTPVRDLGLGVMPPAPTRVDESFEIDRDDQTIGLPAGSVRLVERERDGSVVVLGSSRLFDDSTRKANVDTISIGTAAGVTGHRERRDISIDETRKRMTEEFTITIANARPQPISVVVREHMYRSLNWTLAYYSAPRTEQEGSQQVSMHVDVPAQQSLELLYVAVYPLCSDEAHCP